MNLKPGDKVEISDLSITRNPACVKDVRSNGALEVRDATGASVQIPAHTVEHVVSEVSDE